MAATLSHQTRTAANSCISPPVTLHESNRMQPPLAYAVSELLRPHWVLIL